ncbi:MAG: hypothetical protein H6865_04940 [Rhodospirillales bacterium]|nr:hypothetical protein [Alphaproteobacteria bacterium]MCB9986964.1 hypothetical protein [Rhodospirillales bacterium]USO08261.1 MAG: hypothetical protein H6866_03350 [Rhodospirillales bacterium]
MNIGDIIIEFECAQANEQMTRSFAEARDELQTHFCWNPENKDKVAAMLDGEFGILARLDASGRNLTLSVYPYVADDDNPKAFAVDSQKISETRLNFPSLFGDTWRLYISVVATQNSAGRSVQQIDHAEFTRGQLHDELARKLTKALDQFGLKSILGEADNSGSITIDLLCEYYFQYVPKGHNAMPEARHDQPLGGKSPA